MKLSNRITGLLGDGSDGWEVFLEARDMIKDGLDVTALTIGEHDISTAAPLLQHKLKTALAGHTAFPYTTLTLPTEKIV